MKKIQLYISALLISALWISCSKEERVDYADPNAPSPGQITIRNTEELAGAVNVVFSVPKDPNFLYARAVYEIQPGVFREAKSSVFNDTLKLVGFGSTEPHEVKIFSVGKNEKASEPVVISVSPLTPPVRSLFGDLTLNATFGGVRVNFKNNITNAPVALIVLVDSTGLNTWSPITTFYTGAKEGGFSLRGYDNNERKFAVFIRDRWNNKSDTLIKVLSPLPEQLIPKPYDLVKLPGDHWQNIENYRAELLWNGTNTWPNIFATDQRNPMPQWVTINLKSKVRLSRLKEFQYSDHLYKGGAVKSFEIWGSNNPDQDGGWNNWVKLQSFSSFKPSGSPLGTATQDDRNYALVNGEDFEFTEVPDAYRYIRFKTTSTYSSAGQVVIGELTFFGQIVP